LHYVRIHVKPQTGELVNVPGENRGTYHLFLVSSLPSRSVLRFISTRLRDNLMLRGQRRDTSDRPGSTAGCQQGYHGGQSEEKDLTRHALSERPFGFFVCCILGLHPRLAAISRLPEPEGRRTILVIPDQLSWFSCFLQSTSVPVYLSLGALYSATGG